MNVLRQLGLDHELASRLHAFPNGATAMQAMAQDESKKRQLGRGLSALFGDDVPAVASAEPVSGQRLLRQVSAALPTLPALPALLAAALAALVAFGAWRQGRRPSSPSSQAAS